MTWRRGEEGEGELRTKTLTHFSQTVSERWAGESDENVDSVAVALTCPAVIASLVPVSAKSASNQPQNRFSLFHALSPWRTMTIVYVAIVKSSKLQLDSDPPAPESVLDMWEGQLPAVTW